MLYKRAWRIPSSLTLVYINDVTSVSYMTWASSFFLSIAILLLLVNTKVYMYILPRSFKIYHLGQNNGRHYQRRFLDE